MTNIISKIATKLFLMKKINFLLALLFLFFITEHSSAASLQTKTSSQPTYFFATFTGDGINDMKLQIYSSTDAVNYSLYSDTQYSGPAGCSLRDPSIMKHTDGKYYLVFTAAPYGKPYDYENIVGVAWSSDLKVWTTLPSIHTDTIGGGVKNTWAPEWVIDDNPTPRFVVSCSSARSDLRPYLFTALDNTFTKWSAPVDLGVGSVYLDGQIVKNNNIYHFFVKSTPNLRHATAPTITGPWTWETNRADWESMEGPCVVKLADGTWRMYVDPMNGPVAYTNSTDLYNWSSLINLPGPGSYIKHGTIIKDSTFKNAPSTLSIDINKPGIKISPTHYGLFFEDINHAADGGIYAELISNRSFEDAATPDNWSVVTQTGASASTTIETTNLLNSVQTKALKLSIVSASATARAGVANSGFWGVPVVNGNEYKVSFFAKCDQSFAGNVIVSLESISGEKYSEATISGINTVWKKYTCTLKATGSNASGRFVISTNAAGTLWLDVVSLFPPTYNNRENGLRPEFVELLKDMKPKFFRFPGGCFVEGDWLANRFQWKKTIGKIEERPGHTNMWGYRTSDGMGFHEFLELCEDVNAPGLYVVNVGLSHRENQDYNNLDGYIQDALNAIEYANGPVTSTYGAMRAANGHPSPFNIKYVEIGNENYAMNNYGNRYIKFYNAIKAKYPTIQCISDTDNPTWTLPYKADYLDEHYYNDPTWFINEYNRYDSISRSGPKVYVGEYAVTKNCGLGNLSAAIGEAVFMAGMEKNSDVVQMNSYAPIFVNVNNRKWGPDLINYNASSYYCTPSYYLQKLFANNIGTVNIPVEDSEKFVGGLSGKIGLGTWITQADFDSVKVKNSYGENLFLDQFDNNSNWTPGIGTWSVSNGVYSQAATSTGCLSIGPNIMEPLYTYSLKARKTGGNEGFLILFGYTDSNNYYSWNIGGWTNTKHVIEQCVSGKKSQLSTVMASIVSNKWYNIRIEVSASEVRCYLDNTLIQSIKLSKKLFLYTCASLDEQTSDIYVKVVNPSATAIMRDLEFKGLGAALDGTATVLTSASVSDENSLATPEKVVPAVTSIDSVSSTFNYTFKANSVTILKLKEKSSLNSIHVTKKSDSNLGIYPNPNNGHFYLKGTDSGIVSVNINGLDGKTFKKIRVDGGSQIDFSAIPAGIYIINVNNGSQSAFTKMIKN